MKLYILSDLHNEVRPFDVAMHAHVWRPQADVVVLAGDIDNGVQGLKWAAERFCGQPVVYVAGNHEFYGHDWNRTVDELRQVARDEGADFLEKGVHFLENDSVEIMGVRFLGCTLWTDFEMFGEGDRAWAMQRTASALNDYRLITNDCEPAPRKLIPEDTRLRHWASRAWLERELAVGDPERTVVVTHHFPCLQSCAPRYRTNPVSAGFGSQLPPTLLARAKLWIHGHTHDSSAYTLRHQEADALRETGVVCNPRGYPRGRGNENEWFEPELIVEI